MEGLGSFIPCAHALLLPRAVDDQKKVAKFRKFQLTFPNLAPSK